MTKDKLPAHSVEAERGVLGCILLHPKIIEDVNLKEDHFYEERHRYIYGVFRRLWSKYKAFDLITLVAYLNKKGTLQNLGGIEYLSNLQDCVPSVHNLPNYQGIVQDKFKRRKIAETCDKIAKLTDSDINTDELLFVAQSDLADVFTDERKIEGDTFTWSDLTTMNTESDENNIIGVVNGKTTRYLCKGHSAWLIGPSGVGKSSLMLQMGVSFALGRPIWGVTPQRQLRVLVIQAENDKGDMAEMAKGAEIGLGIFGDESLEKQIRIRSVTGKIGQSFCAWLRKEIESFGAELVLVDPLLSFAGIDVSRQDQCSMFCRVWLDPVLRDTGAVLLSVHHTGKPKQRNGKDATPLTLNELAYEGLGSSELVNWARAVMFLQNVGDGTFKLMFAKRGKRAGAVHPNLEPTQVVWLQHAKDGTIFWNQIEEPLPPEVHAGKPGRTSKVEKLMAAGLGPVLDSLKEPVGLKELGRRIMNHAGKLKIDVSMTSARNAIELLVESGALIKENNEYKKS